MSRALRLRWVLDALDLDPGDDVLELGGGNGVAAELVLERLATGTFVGLDRSEIQVDRTARRNARAVADGRARFLVGALEEAAFPPGSFDLVFAVSVNHFWTKRAAPELQRLTRMLRPGGALRLFYEAFTPAGASEIQGKLSTAAAAAGLESRIVRDGCRVELRIDAPGIRES